jgi:hypothetical protein
MKCAACGSTALIEGTLQADDGSIIKFQPNDAPWVKRIFAMGRRDVRVYGCIHCQQLQFAVGFSGEDMERYQQFEGEQPNVLDRINADSQGLKGQE